MEPEPMQQDRGAIAGATGVVGTWAAWFVAHIEQINSFMQFFVLLAGLVSSVFAIRFYRSRTDK